MARRRLVVAISPRKSSEIVHRTFRMNSLVKTNINHVCQLLRKTGTILRIFSTRSRGISDIEGPIAMNAKNILKLGVGGVLCGTVYVLILIASIFLCAALLLLPERFGVRSFMLDQIRRNSWMVLVAIPVFLIQLVLPFLAARWFYRASDRIAARCFGIARDNDRIW